MKIIISVSTTSNNPIHDYIDDDDKIVKREILKYVKVYYPTKMSHPYSNCLRPTTLSELTEPVVRFLTNKGRIIIAEPRPATVGVFIINFYEVVKNLTLIGRLFNLNKKVPVGCKVSYITIKD